MVIMVKTENGSNLKWLKPKTVIMVKTENGFNNRKWLKRKMANVIRTGNIVIVRTIAISVRYFRFLS